MGLWGCRESIRLGPLASRSEEDVVASASHEPNRPEMLGSWHRLRGPGPHPVGQRVARLPVLGISESAFGTRLGLGTIEQARGGVEDVAQSFRGVPDHDALKSLVGTSDHLIQLCLHIGNWFGNDVFHQWLLFDDLWAGGNPDLADGVLRYAKRWDVLS